jgi:RNA polymerase sigma-B factor
MRSAVSTLPRERALPVSGLDAGEAEEVQGSRRLTDSAPLLLHGDDAQALLQEFALTRDPDIRARLVLMHGRIVRYLASRFDSRSVPQEDLIQVAYIGLISALDRFDPARGVSFITYAIPTILGEIKRYFRDQTWALKAPRRLRELGLTLRRVRRELEQELGRAPTIQEMADVVAVSEERLLQAMEVDRCYKPCSLDSQLAGAEGGAGVVSDCVGEEDPEIAEVEQRGALSQVIGCLERRQRQIIQLRFFEELSQAEVAQHLGISQMHVSRLERQALGHLRDMLTAPA